MDASKLTETFWPYIDYLKRLGAYSSYCASSEITSAACQGFRFCGMIVSEVILLLVLLMWLKNAIQDQIDFNKYKKRMAARAVVADPEVMAKHTWQVENSDIAHLSQQELAEKIRESKKINDTGSTKYPHIPLEFD
jgi:hypothetical protein